MLVLSLAEVNFCRLQERRIPFTPRFRLDERAGLRGTPIAQRRPLRNRQCEESSTIPAKIARARRCVHHLESDGSRMLTIFSTPKPFEGHSNVIQRNAIKSWTLLHPEVEVILFGDEEGTAEACRDLAIHHEPQVIRNEYGTK